MDQFEQRLARVEDRVAKLEIKSAVDYERHESIVKRLDRIDGHISKLVWLIIMAIGGGFLSWVVNGGLHGGLPGV